MPDIPQNPITLLEYAGTLQPGYERVMIETFARESDLLAAIPFRPISGGKDVHFRTAALPTVTYHMNRLQHLETRRQYCVSLNPSAAIAAGHEIARFAYAHPVFAAGRVAAASREARAGSLSTSTMPSARGSGSTGVSRPAPVSPSRC